MKTTYNRQSIRLRKYNYSSPGMYFITICTYNKNCIFGNIINNRMKLNEFGKIVQNEWLLSEKIRKEIKLDEFIIMPNHLHGIVQITVGATGSRPLTNNQNNKGDRITFQHPIPLSPEITNGLHTKSIGALITGFKSSVTKQINKTYDMTDTQIWQRNYYEHIIRNEISLKKIREYIITNPMKWQFDYYNSVGATGSRP